MERTLFFLFVFLMVRIPSFAGGIIGVWEQNPHLHNYQGDNDAIVFWQFTEDGQFRYEESCCGIVNNALQGRYSLSGTLLTFTLDDVIYHNDYDAASFTPGMAPAIEVSFSGNEMIFSANPFAEVATLILNRISDYSRFSPNDVLPGTWSNSYVDCHGRLDSDESNATRLNPDNSLFYVYEDVPASGTWSISADNKLCWIYEKSDNANVVVTGIQRCYPILICCPERVSLLQQEEGEDMAALPVFIPSDGSLIDKYFGGVSEVDAGSSPRIVASGNTLLIENADRSSIAVFDIDGKIVIARQPYDGKPIVLPSGCYIVKVNDAVFKITINPTNV